MTDFKDIDDLFKSQQNDWNGEPSDAAWNKLSDDLDNYAFTKRSSNRLVIRWSIAASVIVLLGLTFFFTTSNFKNAQLAESPDQMITVPASHSAAEEKENSRLDKRTFKSDKAETISEIKSDESIKVGASTKKIASKEIISEKLKNNIEIRNKNDGFNTFSDASTNKKTIDAEVFISEESLEPSIAYNDEITEDASKLFENEVAVQDLDDLITKKDRGATALSNSSGMAMQKAKHQQDKNSKDIGVGDAYADKSIDDELGEEATLPAIAQVSEVNRMVAKEKHAKRGKGYTNKEEGSILDENINDTALSNKIVYVHYPSKTNDSCNTILKIDQNNAYILNCDFSKIGNNFPLNKTLSEFYNLPLSELREIEFDEVYRDCQKKNSLKIIVEYGMDSKRFQETTQWNLDCISSKNKSYIKQIEKLIESN